METPKVTRISMRFLFSAEAYLVRGHDRHVLIDTGMSRRRSRLLGELRAAGCPPEDLALVVLTHAHPDHAGSCRFLQAEHGVPVAVHPHDAEKVRTGDMFAGTDHDGGLTARVVKTLLAPFGMGRFTPFEPDLLLGEGHDLSSHGLEASVVHLPGHSPGSIGILTSAGDLFCGDLLTGTGGPTRNKIIDDPADYAASVERLHSLGVRTVYPGHGSPFVLEELWRTEAADGR